MLDANLYGKLVIGVKGLIQQRQIIMEQWPEGQHIVFIDDDVASIDSTLSDVFKDKTLDYFFQTAFEETRRGRSYIWGVYESRVWKSRHAWCALLVRCMGLLTDQI